MVEDGLIKFHKIGQNDPLYYFLPTTKAPTVFSHKHEKDCADLFIAYKSTGLLKAWNSPENFEDYQDYVKAGVLPDRVSIIGKSIVFWEVDRGTESYQKISDKIPNYITLSRRHPEHKFYVCFTTNEYHRFKNGKKVLRQSAETRAKRILLDAMEYKRGNQFIVGLHKQIIQDPLGSVFVSPLTPESYISLQDFM